MSWLLLLCFLLIVWHPLSLAIVAARALPALPVRGLPMAIVLVARLLVTGLGVGAGLALVRRRPGAVTLAKWALVLSAATEIFVYTTPFFPANQFPGDIPLLIGWSLAYHGAWIAYLFRSKRVRSAFPS